MENPEETPGKLSLLLIRLQEKIFGLYSKGIVGLIEVPNMTKVPGAPDFMRGVIKLNGCYIPVIDLRIKLDMTKTVFTVNTCLLIYNHNVHNVPFQAALLIDAIDEVKELQSGESIDLSNFEHHDIIEASNYDHVDKVLIINMESIFSLEDLEKVALSVSEAAI